VNTGRPLSAAQKAKLKASPGEASRSTSGSGWTDEEMAAMGTMIDRELAERFGRSTQAVALKRKKMGIPSRAGGRNPTTPLRYV
jgi:hypothetical protein